MTAAILFRKNKMSVAWSWCL